MNPKQTPKEDEFAIAVHEAGHLLVGLVLGRKIQTVTLDFINQQRGCFWDPLADKERSDFVEVACLLAGPRAQVEVCPHSIPKDRIFLFQKRIIQPMTEPRRIPSGIYDYMGWQYDIAPIYERLCLPDAPAAGMPWNMTHSKVIEMVELQLLTFFGNELVRDTVLKVASQLHSQRVLDGDDAVATVGQTPLLETALRKRWLQWM